MQVQRRRETSNSSLKIVSVEYESLSVCDVPNVNFESFQKMNLFVKLLLLFTNTCLCQRISSILKPVHYDLVILPIINGDHPRLCGHVFIDLIPNNTTNTVIFHSVELDILDVSAEPVTSEDGTVKMTFNDRLNTVEELCFLNKFDKVSKDVDVIREDVVKQQMSVVLKRNLLRNQKYRIGIFYTGKVIDGNVGFFRANYDSSSCLDKWYTVGY